MPEAPFTIATGGLPLEGEARDGTLTWQTLNSADRTPSPSLEVGVAAVPAGGHLAFHRHAPAAHVFRLTGAAAV